MRTLLGAIRQRGGRTRGARRGRDIVWQSAGGADDGVQRAAGPLWCRTRSCDDGMSRDDERRRHGEPQSKHAQHHLAASWSPQNSASLWDIDELPTKARQPLWGEATHQRYRKIRLVSEAARRVSLYLSEWLQQIRRDLHLVAPR